MGIHIVTNGKGRRAADLGKLRLRLRYKRVATVNALLTVGSCPWRTPGLVQPSGWSPIGEVVC
jgi:hypothetical protein